MLEHISWTLHLVWSKLLYAQKEAAQYFSPGFVALGDGFDAAHTLTSTYLNEDAGHSLSQAVATQKGPYLVHQQQ